jgi:light-regulated signal transduction histidine kinase (bacteriophytochrome)
VLSELDGEIQSKGAVVQYDSLPSIMAIPGQAYQLFQNLISNSLKFCKEGTVPQVTIHTETLKGKVVPGVQEKFHENTYYRIYVRDNGIGFDPKYAEDIFVVFKRLHSYHEFEGTGIGLSICKKIVEQHKGQITAEGQPGKGATFIITLPGQETARE